MIAVYSKNYTKPINTLCGENSGLLNTKEIGTYSYHCLITLSCLLSNLTLIKLNKRNIYVNRRFKLPV
jgi:hypothetical protein